jgi:tRNA A37 threonylcarbamoyladenosine biosynthesis protein TsaE
MFDEIDPAEYDRFWNDEAEFAEWVAAMEEAELSLVEWPEKAPNLVPEHAVVFNIEFIDPDQRRIYTNQ